MQPETMNTYTEPKAAPKSAITLALLVLALLMLAGCGETKGDRALSGAGIGAGVGAVGGAMMGDPVTGAAIGGAAGAATGAMTDKDDIDAGDPVWRR